jgi:hypothetical protein
LAESYDAPKEWHGRRYTGMKVGRIHRWSYEGEWRERKLTPDVWEVSFHATKHRHGHAPEGSGAPEGTEYHWFFPAISQTVRKLDANAYETHLQGLKWKLGFKPATAKGFDYTWQRSKETARERAIRILEQTLADLKLEEKEKAPAMTAPVLGEEADAILAPGSSKGTSSRKARKGKAAKAAAELPSVGAPGEAEA